MEPSTRDTTGRKSSYGEGKPNVDVAVDDEDAEMRRVMESYIPDTAEEKRLVKKIDMVLLPVLWWMYILAYLDRGNIVSDDHEGTSWA